MSEKISITRKYPLWRSVFFPFYSRDQLKIIMPILLLGLMVSLLMWDIFPLLLTIALGYAGFIKFMSGYTPFLLEFGPNNLTKVTEILNGIPGIVKSPDELLWHRGYTGWLSSTLDSFFIETIHPDRYILLGRKPHIRQIYNKLITSVRVAT